MPEKKWNVMIYLAGDNNLSEEMVWALTQMKLANVGGNAITVLFDPRGSRIPVCLFETPALTSPSDPLYDGATVLFSSEAVRQQEEADFRSVIAGKYTVPHDWQLQTENTADPLTLLYFLWRATRARQNAAGTDWQDMLIVSGHGSGLDEDFLARDDNPRGSLTIPGIAKVLKTACELSGRKISILGLDSCQLSTAEIYTQVAPSIEHLVASEGFAPNGGWPYGKILSNLDPDPTIACEKIVRDYLEFYFEYPLGGESVDLSACRTRSVESCVLPERLAVSVSDLGKSLKAALSYPRLRDAVILAHWWAQSYISDQYADIVDFVDVLRDKVEEVRASAVGDDGVTELISCIQAHCVEVRRAVGAPGEPGIVTATGYVGPAVQHSHGLSIYFPWSQVMSHYRDLTFAQTTQWHEFLQEYVEATRKPVRVPLGQQLPLPTGSGTRDSQPAGNAAADHRANEPYNKANEPYNKANEPYNKGGCSCISMKNPPIDWGRCDLLQGFRVSTGKLGSQQLGSPGPLF